ncbi:putative serine protease 45 [Leucoraja erinacea]|uniref:putative serine protease 45 n=1 Tax=Leucoraja erinaceus TaxID=7782 RepID=UPI0024574E5F|nr:putative serine protease 45 [Leucoraja erinacea]
MYSEALFESLVIVTGTLKLEGMQIIYGVHKVILHEYFIFELFGVKIPDNDIALVMVKEPIVFNKLVSPICFPDDRYLDMSTLENCWVTGWQMLSLGNYCHFLSILCAFVSLR